MFGNVRYARVGCAEVERSVKLVGKLFVGKAPFDVVVRIKRLFLVKGCGAFKNRKNERFGVFFVAKS